MTDTITEELAKEIFSSFLDGENALKLGKEQIVASPDETADAFVLRHPWGDSTLVLIVPSSIQDARNLAAALEKVDFPSSYSGILHRQPRALEVFWTAFKMREKHDEIKTRSFYIWWRGRKRECRFGPASQEAMTIAAAIAPIAAPSHTDHRNIMSFHYHAHGYDIPHMGDPVCFRIDCSGIDDIDLDDYLRTVNFYMTYYDRETPRILIHESGPLRNESLKPRYTEGAFPSEIVANGVDPSVTSFWLGSFETRDPAMKYLLHYRLMEYLSLSYVKSEQRRHLIDILRRPHLISSTEGAAAEIASLFASQVRETDRLKLFISETVSPDKVWKVLEMNKDYFCTDTDFDGGHTIKKVINANSTLDSMEGKRSYLTRGSPQINSKLLGAWTG